MVAAAKNSTGADKTCRSDHVEGLKGRIKLVDGKKSLHFSVRANTRMATTAAALTLTAD